MTVVFMVLTVHSKRCFCTGAITMATACPLQVAEQVGELLVHCRYGCQPKPDMPEEYEVASSGCPVVVKMHQRQ